MPDFDTATILSLIKDVRDLFSAQRASMRPSPTQSQLLVPGEGEIPKSLGQYQAPIRGSWKNSGDFSPGRATNPRHPQGHQGVDMRASGGTSVYPMAPGIVTSVGTDPKGGNIVLIQHDNGIKTYSAHLGTVNVHKGDKVGMDTVIGTVGNTGNANVT